KRHIDQAREIFIPTCIKTGIFDIVFNLCVLLFTIFRVGL
ncbi:MAG: hypothetical protein ACI965_001885, partial [Paraglaciecola sp.]